MSIIKHLWDNWKKIAKTISIFQARLLLTLFYFTFLLPFGVIFALKKKKINAPAAGWKPKMKQSETLEEMRQQF